MDGEFEFDLQVKFGEAWTNLYRFSLQEQLPVDYEAVNWYTSTYPDLLFVRNVIAARPGPHRRHTLFNDKFTIRHIDGKVERRVLSGAKELGEVLTHYFAIRLPRLGGYCIGCGTRRGTRRFSRLFRAAPID